MPTQIADNFMYLLATKAVDFHTDAFNVILMVSGFVYNRVTHIHYSDVIASELATANGYTQGGVVLAGHTVTSDTTNHKTTVAWTNPSWTITPAAVTASGAIIYDDTITTPDADPIVEYIDFGGDYTQDPGGNFVLTNVTVDIGKVTGV